MMEIKGCPPSRKRQFCTDHLKLAPMRRWIREHFGPSGRFAGQSFVRYKGVRRDESQGRKNTAYEEWDDYYDCTTYAPLVDWPKQWCFDYVKAHGEPINPLYALGFKRVGCAPCINSNREDILNWSTRFPEMIDKIRAWEQRTGLTFFMPMERDGRRNNMDQVLDWARSKPRRPKDRLLPMMHDRPACESKYGLCE
jgi:3'-phosphoadenosine 5'-phosphosulfate sulfotransferase (PAPS reductase)/FAD synthetase